MPECDCGSRISTTANQSNSFIPFLFFSHINLLCGIISKTSLQPDLKLNFVAENSEMTSLSVEKAK
jgi:hypothetical protein